MGSFNNVIRNIATVYEHDNSSVGPKLDTLIALNTALVRVVQAQSHLLTNLSIGSDAATIAALTLQLKTASAALDAAVKAADTEH